MQKTADERMRDSGRSLVRYWEFVPEIEEMRAAARCKNVSCSELVRSLVSAGVRKILRKKEIKA